ncbi:MAG: hypothetical protein WCA37_10165 [Terracidiphilus sp.]
MRGSATANIIAFCATGLLASLGFASAPAADPGADLIVTAAPVYVPRAELQGQERFPKGAHLLLLHAGIATPLLPEFAASADADVFFDGARVLFAGKQKPADPWQIWELDLKDHSVRKVVTTATDAERPLYLPAGRMVYALRTSAGFNLDSNDDGHPLAYTPLNPTTDPGELQLVYVHASAFPTDILKDGRVLFESAYPLGDGAAPEMYLVYPDGSGLESYRCDHGRARWGGTQLSSGDVVFTHGASLARFTSPLAHEVRIAAPPAEYAGAIAETAAGDWLISARTQANPRYVIKLWKPGSTAMQTLFAQSGENLLEPVLVAARKPPTRFPSGLHPWDYANLLALDARLSRDGALQGTPSHVRLETLDAAGHAVLMGTAPVEKDGSFFIKVPGNQPIRLSLLDAKGHVLRQEHGWFFSRGGEQRICVGCHTGPERASENRVPEVLLQTTTPVDLTVAPRHTLALHAGTGGR